ncbi:hypothetical protein QBC42DRAFT_290341 [Cladorrhinum samala]|uniref:Fe2OG dioxygenase domain-containing protein n=1 Tax=Cladorrhinum samala TaxID=585594 RepID=A0AAV9HE02_9PEZI|nr:hypothetical protein QBC42DRAFT_290341 [Cladorrhinum samala]
MALHQLRPAPEPAMDPETPNILSWPDLGLTLIIEFITQEEEAALIAGFDANLVPCFQPNPKKRISQHHGHHFDYTTFGTTSKITPVPDYIASWLPRMPIYKDKGGAPDQFTVQYYPPGSGIPPHVDTHSMFGEALYSLSFGSGVCMAFKKAGKEEARRIRMPKRSLGVVAKNDGEEAKQSPNSKDENKKDKQNRPDHNIITSAEEKEEEEKPFEIMLPARSLLVMTGPSRYGYTHGIKPRKTDIVDGKVVLREGRYSVTMRSVRRTEDIGCDCAYPGVCDARIREEQEEARKRAELDENM